MISLLRRQVCFQSGSPDSFGRCGVRDGFRLLRGRLISRRNIVDKLPGRRLILLGLTELLFVLIGCVDSSLIGFWKVQVDLTTAFAFCFRTPSL